MSSGNFSGSVVANQVRYIVLPNTNDAYRVGDDASLWSRWTRNWGKKWIGSIWWQMTPTINPTTGYYQASLWVNGVPYKVQIHQLVAAAFLGPCPAGMEVDHKNGIKSDSRLDNLVYSTHIDNLARRKLHGTLNSGVRNGQATFTPEEIEVIREKYRRGGKTQRQIAEEHCTVQAHVSRIVNYRNWK